jgi:uncharacterized membrane protein YkoI
MWCMIARRRLAVVLLAAMLGMAGGASPATADQNKNRNSFTGQEEQGGGCMPLKSVIRSVARQYGGRVLDAGLGGNGVYIVRVLTGDGQVLDVAVDCGSGQVLGVRGGG